MLKNPLRSLRIWGIIEGISFLLLLLVAMPIKYIAGHPEGVQVIGLIHGVLFVIYIGFALLTAGVRKWPLSRLTLAFIASVLPLGTFVFDRSLKKEEEQAKASPEVK